MYNEKIVDAKTGEEALREFTAKEIAELEKQQAEARAKAEQESVAKQAKEQARKEILESIGLTEEQIQALIG